MDFRIKPLVIAVLHALAEMRYGPRPFHLFVTERGGIEVLA